MIQPQIYLAISLVELGWIVGALLAVFTGLSIVVLSLTWLERKFLGRLQLRYGPTRTGLFGLLQPLADAVKLIIKEDIIPSSSDKALFWIAPIIVFIPAFMIWVTIPATQDLVLRNLELGLFYIIAFDVVAFWVWFWRAGVLPTSTASWGVSVPPPS